MSRFYGPECELPPELDHEQRAVLLRPGYVVANRFEVVELLGFGGMGAVYHVKDRNLYNEDKALKVMLPSLLKSETARERFLGEVRISQNLRHDGIVTVYDLGEDTSRGFCFFTMEYVPGVTLHRLIKERGGRLSITEALSLTEQMCTALAYAHTHTIHRDLKPQNVMVRPDGRVKILDFGLAKVMSPGRMTKSSMALGTAYYQAPEQSVHAEDVDQSADIYSVGVMLYEMLTGVIPTAMAEPPSSEVPEVSKQLDAVIGRCLKRKPKERYASAAELASALDAAETDSLGKRLVAPLKDLRFPRIPWTAMAVASLMAVLAFTAFAYFSQNPLTFPREVKRSYTPPTPTPAKPASESGVKQILKTLDGNDPATGEARAMEAYNQNPRKCEFCGAILPYPKRNSACCNSTCEASLQKRRVTTRPSYCPYCANAIPFEMVNFGYCSEECQVQYAQYLAQQQQEEADMLRAQNAQAVAEKRRENRQLQADDQRSAVKTYTSSDSHTSGTRPYTSSSGVSRYGSSRYPRR